MNDHRAIRVTTLYRFSRFDDCAAIQQRLKEVCGEAGLRGTLILAREGINGTIAGAPDDVERVLEEIRSLHGCEGLEVKDSFAREMPFQRMKVKVKPEIVTMGEPDIDPLEDVGHYLAPEDWNAFISDPDTILIDTRNDYEVEIGTFRNAINPETKFFRDFPAWFREWRSANIGDAPAPRIAMFCTGGIRCEKATAFLKAEGLEEVYHLEGGILKYLEVVPEAQSLWQGDCFVFDERGSLAHGLEPGAEASEKKQD